MPIEGAGLLLYRRTPALEVFVAHMGGPYWARRQEGAWTIPKGAIDPGETELEAAQREFTEEIGVEPPPGPPTGLGAYRVARGKTVHMFAIEASGFEVDEVVSNEFEVEWPTRSGIVSSYPEIDEAKWLPVADARPLLVAGQRPVLDALEELVASS
ncbi:NUDIX domain-containing protein [Agromyces sp. MMS24-JH15]|uniref:NUDIX domain-containing protein n=1 Tax=Agromyces sp. MMS24-JH15 TaxID=3243765 RepID=UPI003747ACA8